MENLSYTTKETAIVLVVIGLLCTDCRQEWLVFIIVMCGMVDVDVLILQAPATRMLSLVSLW